MARRNRVTPFGEIVAVPQRGLVFGNRGVLPDDTGQVRRGWQVKRWLLCLLEFRGRRRPLADPGRYTALFFLDEATGLAAGHRPCFECRRARFLAFRDAWAAAGPPTWQGRWRSESVKLEGTFSPDNRVRAYGTDTGAIHLVSPETDQEIARLPSPEVGRIQDPAFSTDGSRLLARGAETGSLYVFDLRRIREQLAALGLDWPEVQPVLPARSGDDNPALAPTLQVELIDAEWATRRAALDRLLAQDVAELNRLAREGGVRAVVTPAPRPTPVM